MTNITDIAYTRYLARQKFKDRFLAVFGKPLDKRFFNNLTGFDAIAFDVFVSPEPNESTIDAIRRQYGQEAVEIIEGLLKAESNWHN